jgi:uncharacterized protein YkwD
VTRRVGLALVLAAACLWLPLAAAPVGAVAYDRFYANFGGEELMRAMNLDRLALGLPALATDATLEAIARDRAIACPSNPALIIRGRARDMADRDYLSHTIPGCHDAAGGTFDAFDLLRAAGYSYVRGAETIADNTYPASAATYATGCSVTGTSCHGSTTLPWTVAVAERAFMGSSVHRANILSTVSTRFGCAAWASGTGPHYFSCYFVQAGSGVLDSAGPAISRVSGIGAVFARGSTPTFTALAVDAHSALSDGWAAIDGVHIRSWAWDHLGTSGGLTAIAPALRAGTHTFNWWVRDASGRSNSATFHFSVP